MEMKLHILHKITIGNSGLVFGLFWIFLFSGCGNLNQNGPGLNGPPSFGKRQKSIVFYGNSLTAGFGLENQSDRYTDLLQKKIDSLALAFSIVNAGVNGETSSGGKARLNWLLKKPMDIFVLELGANDGLRGIKLTETESNLDSITKAVIERYPACKVLIAGMQVPPNMGQAYCEEFKNIYPKLAEKYNATLIPFLLAGVAGETKLNLPDGIHPNTEGQKIVATNVWNKLYPIMLEINQ